MYRHGHIRLKLDFSALSRPSIGHTRHIECYLSVARHHVLLAARANGVPIRYLAGCARSWGAVRAPPSSGSFW